MQTQPTAQTPDRQTPVVDHETEEALNIPGRGVVDHGVPVKGPFNADLTDAENQTQLVTYDDPPTPPSPVPVYIVSTDRKGRVIHDFRTLYAAVVASVPGMIAGQHETRSKLRIINSGSNTVYVSNDPASANTMFGYPLAQGATLELNTSRAVYASADPAATNPVSLNLLEEFDQTIFTG